MAGFGDEAFAVVPVLDLCEGAARGAEVFEDPGGEALEEIGFFELVAPGELVLVKPYAELFGPDFVGVSIAVNRIAVKSLFDADSELAEDERFFPCGLEWEIGELVGGVVVPTDVFVDGEDVGEFSEGVVYEDSVEVAVVASGHADEACGGDESGWVGGAGDGGEVSAECGLDLASLIFVSDGPDDDAGAVAVSVDHLGEVGLGVGAGDGVFEIEHPVDWDLGPDHESEFVGDFEHVLVVRVVGEADIVASEFFGAAQEFACVGFGVGAAFSVGGFFVEADASEENGLVVEEDVSALGCDCAETDLVLYFVDRCGCDVDLVEGWAFGAPEGEVL
mgnify:FL=1